MKAIIPIALMMIVVAALAFASGRFNEQEPIIDSEPKKINLKTYTSAVCENKGTHVFCKDEFFVNCNGNVWIAKDAAECNGIKIPVPTGMGAAVFEHNWKDPRRSEQI